MKKFNIGFVGLGKLGLPIAEAMANKHLVKGYDIVERESKTVTICNTLEQAIENTEIIFIAVQTPHHQDYDGSQPSHFLPPKNFNYSIAAEVLKKLAPIIKPSQRIVLISTVLPGTVRKQLAPLVPLSPFIYNPYLIAMGTEQADFLNPEMVIMGSNRGGNDPHLEFLKSFYETLMPPTTRYCTGTWEEGESIKIFYNTFISAKLSLVNMIQDVAEKLGHMNVDTVTDALADSNYRIMSKAYMKAGMGDGGPCHPRDNIALRWLSKELDLGYDLFGAIMLSRDVQAKNMAKALLEQAQNVVILGKAFKPNVPFVDGSYSSLVGHYVEELGGRLWFYDPKVPLNELPADETLRTLAKNKNLVFLISYWEKWVKEFPFPPGAIVLDPWREEIKLPKVEHKTYGKKMFTDFANKPYLEPMVPLQ